MKRNLLILLSLILLFALTSQGCNKFTSTSEGKKGTGAQGSPGQKYYQKAQELINLKKYDEGTYDGIISNLKKAVKAEPHNPAYWEVLQVVYFEWEKYDEATTEFKRAVRRYPRVAKVHDCLASTYWVNHKFDKAISEYKKAIELAPNEPEFHFHLGLVYFDQKRYDEAVTEYKKAIELNPEHPINNLTRACLGSVYRKQDRIDVAIKEYEKAIEACSYNVMAYDGLIDIYKEKKMYNKAIELLKEAIERTFQKNMDQSVKYYRSKLKELEKKPKGN